MEKGKRLAADYYDGKTRIKIMEPTNMTKEEIDKVLDDYHKAGWAIIDELIERGEDVQVKKLKLTLIALLFVNAVLVVPIAGTSVTLTFTDPFTYTLIILALWFSVTLNEFKL